MLRLDGEDLRDLPLSERRVRLLSLGLDDVAWQVPPAYDDGPMLLEAAEQQGLEGIVSKRLTSSYRPGPRPSARSPSPPASSEPSSAAGSASSSAAASGAESQARQGASSPTC